MTLLNRDCELVGSHITLRRMNPEEDAQALYRISHDTEQARQLFKFLPRGPYESETAMRLSLAGWCEVPSTVAFTVRTIIPDSIIGTLSLMQIREEHLALEIGNVWYTPSAQRTKANTEAVYLLLKHSFETCGFRRVEWKCDTRNQPSARAALRLGFTFEGVFRKHMLVRGANRDTAWFAMLDDQWPARKVAIENWLYSVDSPPLSEVHPTSIPYSVP